MRSRRLLAAFLGAAVVAGALHVSVSAFIRPPRAYVGPLFWAEFQSSTPGSRWLPPPSRAHLPAGSSFSSFPDRVWRSPLAAAPPNDSCHADGDPLRTDADVGPYGLQVVQYVGDWWRGLVYRPHAATLGPATEWLFGYFDFAPRAGRVAVGAHGQPGIFVGNPGACVANAITRLHGALENGKWVSTSTDLPTGRDCLASSQVVLVRMNTGERFDHTWRCGRANSSLPSNRMVEHVERVEESSYRTPAEMVDPPSTIPVAEPSRQPFPAPPGTVWAEWNSSLVRCHWQYGLLASHLLGNVDERADASTSAN